MRSLRIWIVRGADIGRDAAGRQFVTVRHPAELSTRQRAALEISHGLFDLLARIHHERSVLHDGLAQRPPGQKEESRALRTRRDLNALTRREDSGVVRF